MAAAPGVAVRQGLPSDPSAYGEFDHERLLVRDGRRSGATIAIAVHSTRLGPALGGVRMWRYDDPADGVIDALRLGAAMTLKAAVAGLDLGGGKGVIGWTGEVPSGERRDAALLDFADAVQTLRGAYITAEDVGTGPDDMVRIASRTAFVTGLPGGSGDPSPVTATGVAAAIRASVAHGLGSPSADTLTATVIGLGRVGGHLARILAAEGYRLRLTDIDPARRALSDELGAEWIEPDGAVLSDCDVLVPCALGGVIDTATAGELRCTIVCGAANNILAADTVADELAERGILYAPDFVANAGGLINVYGDLMGYSREYALARAEEIETTMAAIFETADAGSLTPLAAARRIAGARRETTAR